MELKSLHKYLGLVLLVPLLGWSLTGIVFLTKPGYEGAYDRVMVKTYPIEGSFSMHDGRSSHESRLVRTALGYHLLQRDEEGHWTHLDPLTMTVRPAPGDEDLKRLVADAIEGKGERYGSVQEQVSGSVFTDTGIEITVDWSTLAMAQKGSDTALINRLYKIHYLQWLGQPTLNKLFGALGICLLLALVVLGVTSLIRKPRL